MNAAIYGLASSYASATLPLFGRKPRPQTIDPLLSFDPRSIAGVSLWLDGADESSMTFVNRLLAQWRDKSGLGRHFAQTVAANRMRYAEAPGGGLAPFGLDGNPAWVERTGVTNSDFATPQGGTLFAVYQSNTVGVWTGFNNGGAADGFTSFNGVSYDPVFRATRIPGSFTVPGALGLPYLYSYIVTPTTQRVSVNGRRVGSVAADFDNWRALSNRTWQFNRGQYGFACEAIHYDRPLTSSEAERIERYLAFKWGVPL